MVIVKPSRFVDQKNREGRRHSVVLLSSKVHTVEEGIHPELVAWSLRAIRGRRSGGHPLSFPKQKKGDTKKNGRVLLLLTGRRGSGETARRERETTRARRLLLRCHSAKEGKKWRKLPSLVSEETTSRVCEQDVRLNKTERVTQNFSARKKRSLIKNERNGEERLRGDGRGSSSKTRRAKNAQSRDLGKAERVIGAKTLQEVRVTGRGTKLHGPGKRKGFVGQPRQGKRK